MALPQCHLTSPHVPPNSCPLPGPEAEWRARPHKANIHFQTTPTKPCLLIELPATCSANNRCRICWIRLKEGDYHEVDCIMSSSSILILQPEKSPQSTTKSPPFIRAQSWRAIRTLYVNIDYAAEWFWFSWSKQLKQYNKCINTQDFAFDFAANDVYNWNSFRITGFGTKFC